MEDGTDVKELYASEGLVEVNVEHNNKIWKFKFKGMSWTERTNLLEECGSITAAGLSEASLVRYLDKLCVGFLKEAPDGFDYRKMSPAFGDKFLIAIAKGISLGTVDITEDEVKN